jgi:hypothetical protein
MQVCSECGSEDILFDAFVDQNGEVVSTFDDCFCPECDGECTPVEQKENE